MKKIALFIGLLCYMFFLGCSGRTPNPVLCYQPGDDALSCEKLKIEMAQIRREVAIKSTRIKERDARNGGLVSLGFLIYPLFEIDTLKAEEIEIQALITRYNNLLCTAAAKRCFLGNRSVHLGRTSAAEFLKDELPETARLMFSIESN